MTNDVSKKIENHALSVALHHMNYNLCRIHNALRYLAMASGVSNLAEMIDAAAPLP